MITKLFGWLAGLALVLIFLVAVSPDLFRGYVFSEDRRTDGQRTYETYCIGCHGTEGLGDGEAAVFLNPKPRNFVNGTFKFFHFGETGPFPSDQSLQVTIRNGLPGSAMPAFPLLTDQEILDVITFIKSLREGGWQTQEIQAAVEIKPLEATTGEEIFAGAGCIGCHQLDVVGSVGGIGPNLTNVGSRRSLDEIIQSIVDPNAVIAEICPSGPCPSGVMPQTFAEILTPEQIQTVATFLSEQK